MKAEQTQYSKPMILPLNSTGTIYVLQDDKGVIIGTGTRDVCEVLLHVLRNQLTHQSADDILARAVRENATPHTNIKSAMTI